MLARGYNGQVTFEDGVIVISRKGFRALFDVSQREDKTIQLAKIGRMKFVRSGLLSPGYLRFAAPGVDTFAMFHIPTDEDTVMFNIGQGKAFKAIHDAVAAQMLVEGRA